MKSIPKTVYYALNRLNKHGYDAYLVGGAVRDYLLKKEITDFDITTNSDVNSTKMIFSDYVLYDVGKKHGTVTVLIDKLKIDITPYRKEENYSDYRHPDKIIFTDNLKEDLKRRDFTINALCIDAQSNIVDLTNGLYDLENKLIRTVGNPKTRFHEDALRILRAIRFKVQLSYNIEEKTDKQIHSLKNLLKHISMERKKEELMKILSFKNSFKTINEYLDVFNTFINLKTIKRKNNNFSNPYYALAYIIKDLNDINLKQLKFSKNEINLIKALIQASHININNDYEFISILSDIHQKQILEYLQELKNKDYSNRYKQLKKYMISLNDLKINGNQIKEYGYKKSEIGQVKKKLLELIHQQKLINSSKSLNNYLKKHKLI